MFQGGSCESLSSKGGALTGSDSGVLELSDSGGGGPPGEWDAVPGIVRQCITHLENTGLRTLGVFRVSPSKKRVRQVCYSLVIAPIPKLLIAIHDTNNSKNLVPRCLPKGIKRYKNFINKLIK